MTHCMTSAPWLGSGCSVCQCPPQTDIGGCGPGQRMVWAERDPWWGHCTLQYTCTLYTPSSGPWPLYNLTPTINCRRLSLFTHTAGHNQQTGGRRKTWRRYKRELFLTSLLVSNCFSVSLAWAGRGDYWAQSHLKGAELTLCPLPAVCNNAIIPHRSALSGNSPPSSSRPSKHHLYSICKTCVALKLYL